jgi:alkylation response protein AidB-like acyl-CoA dehydrogenase
VKLKLKENHMVTANDRELKLIDKTSSEFAKKELKQIVKKSGSEYFTPKYNRVVEKANELDFFHISLPESVGGSGLGYSTLSIILKNICTEDSSLGAIMLANTSACEILLESKKNHY